MAYTQIGPGTTSSSGSASVSYGAGTPEGALLVAIANVRDGTATVDSFSDTASNTWTALDPVGGGAFALQTYAWYCADADSITGASVDFSEDVAANLTIYVFPDGATVTPLDGVDSVVASEGVTPYPQVSVTPTEATSTVLGAIAYRTNRTVGIIGSTYTEGTTAASGQLYSRYAILENAGTSPTGPQWETVSGGTPTTAAILTIAVRMSGEGPGPDPLEVSVGANRAVYAGQTVPVSAAVTGGPGDPEYLWSVQSGPSGGTFDDPTEATTTFTPAALGIGGDPDVYVLRCTVTDSPDSDFDEFTLTVSASPTFSTILTVNSADDWDAVGDDDIRVVLSDSSNLTFATTQGGGPSRLLDLTMDDISLAPGQDMVLVMGAQFVDLAGAEVLVELYDEENELLATLGPESLDDEWHDLRLSFSQSIFTDTLFPHNFRLVLTYTGEPL